MRKATYDEVCRFFDAIFNESEVELERELAEMIDPQIPQEIDLLWETLAEMHRFREERWANALELCGWTAEEFDAELDRRVKSGTN